MNIKNIFNKEKLNLLIFGGLLFLSGCGVSDAPQSYEERDISMEEPKGKTVFTEQEESEETEDSEMFKLYQELVESAQYDWEWVIEPGEYGDFAFLEEYEDSNRVIQEAEVAAECQYDSVKAYSEGLAAVEKDGKWGYIDQTGQVVIELMYDDAGSFSEGKAAVARDNYFEDGLKAWAYINPENTVVIDWFLCYGGAAFREYVGEFHDGLAFVLREIPTIINENGEEVFESYFFINDYVYDSKYKAIPAYVFTDDLMTERKYGLVGLDGKCLIEPVFDWVWAPYGDYVRVEMIVEGKRCEGVIRIKEKVEEAACIIWDAIDSLDNIFTAKDENELKEKYQGDMVYYSLGEYGEKSSMLLCVGTAVSGSGLSPKKGNLVKETERIFTGTNLSITLSGRMGGRAIGTATLLLWIVMGIIIILHFD